MRAGDRGAAWQISGAQPYAALRRVVDGVVHRGYEMP